MVMFPRDSPTRHQTSMDDVNTTLSFLDKRREELLQNEWHSWQTDDDLGPVRLFVVYGAEEGDGSVGLRTSLDWQTTHWGCSIPSLPGVWFISCHLPCGNIEFKAVRGDDDSVIWEGPPKQNRLVDLGDDTQVITGQWGSHTVDFTCEPSAMCGELPDNGTSQRNMWMNLPESERADLEQKSECLDPLRLFVIEGQLEGTVGVRTSLDWQTTNWGYTIPALKDIWFIPCHLSSGDVEFKIVQSVDEELIWEGPSNQNKQTTLGDSTQVILGRWGTNTVETSVDVPCYDSVIYAEVQLPPVQELTIESVESCESPVKNTGYESRRRLSDKEEELISEWMSVTQERDHMTREAVEQENKKHLSGMLSGLHELLHSIGEFKEYLPGDLSPSISELYKTLSNHKEVNSGQFKLLDSSKIVSNGVLRSKHNSSEYIAGIERLSVSSNDAEKRPGKPDMCSNAAITEPSDLTEQMELPKFNELLLDDSMCAADINKVASDIHESGGRLVGGVERENNDQSFSTCNATMDTGTDTATNPLNLTLDEQTFQTSTPHRPRRSSRHRNSEHGSDTPRKRKGKRSKKAHMEADNVSTYRPGIWNILSNVLGWYNKPKSVEAKESLNISID